jgi:ABC-type thiamine transport system ATPase subunit
MRAESSRMRRLSALAAILLAGLLGSGMLMPANASAGGETYIIATDTTVVTHEMGFAREVASRVLFMADGNIVEDAPPAELFDNPKHSRLQDFLSKVL